MVKAKDRNRVYEQIAELREERAALLPIVEALPDVKRLKAIDVLISGLEQYAEATRQRTGSQIVSAPQDSQYARLSLPKAAIKFLEKTGQPQSDEEIWDELNAAGVTVTARRPVHAVHKALERHTKNRWLHYADGKWSLKSPDPAKGGIAGGDLKKHARATSEGIAHFKARTGVRWGKKPKVTPEHIEKFRELYDKGSTVAAASRHAGTSNAYFYMHKTAILSWKKGDPWPPAGGVVNEYRVTPGAADTEPRGVSGDESRAAEVIPLHARSVGENK